MTAKDIAAAIAQRDAAAYEDDRDGKAIARAEEVHDVDDCD